MAAFVVLNSASFTHAPVAALCFLGIHAATTHRRFRSRTYRQLFQVHVTFAFVPADQFTLSIIMAIAIQLQSTTVPLKLSEVDSTAGFSNQPQRYKHQKNGSCTVSHRQGVD